MKIITSKTKLMVDGESNCVTKSSSRWSCTICGKRVDDLARMLYYAALEFQSI